MDGRSSSNLSAQATVNLLKNAMKLLKMSDSEILELAESVRQDVIDGSNSKDWELHSRNMPKHVIKDEKTKQSVERQWREDESASSSRTCLSRDSEFLAVIRKEETVGVFWKQTSTCSEEEFLLKIELREIDGEIKQVGALPISILFDETLIRSGP